MKHYAQDHNGPIGNDPVCLHRNPSNNDLGQVFIISFILKCIKLQKAHRYKKRYPWFIEFKKKKEMFCGEPASYQNRSRLMTAKWLSLSTFSSGLPCSASDNPGTPLTAWPLLFRHPQYDRVRCKVIVWSHGPVRPSASRAPFVSCFILKSHMQAPFSNSWRFF